MPELTHRSSEVKQHWSAQVSSRDGDHSDRSHGRFMSPVMAVERKQCSRSAVRVLHVIDRLGVGGTECGIAKVVQGLGGGEFEHRVCAIRGFDEAFAHNQGLNDKVCVAGQNRSGFQFLIGRLARIMRGYQPHVVHSRNWGAIEAIPAARLAQVPVVIHSEHGYELDMLTGLSRRRRILRRIAYAATDALFTVSEELRTYHARQAWVPTERIRLLPNGVDTQRFCLRPGDRETVRNRLGLAEETIVLGSVGRLVPIKGHGTLLRAAETLIGRGLPVHILLVGSGPELSKHQELVSASPKLRERTTFWGSASNVPELLNAMDVFVQPSLGEGMSNTLLEAMASSLPLVATRVGGNLGLVEDGRSGWLFEPGDVTDLADRLERLTRDQALRSRLGQAARNRVVEHFSLDVMIARYRALYLELVLRRCPLAPGMAPTCAD